MTVIFNMASKKKYAGLGVITAPEHPSATPAETAAGRALAGALLLNKRRREVPTTPAAASASDDDDEGPVR